MMKLSDDQCGQSKAEHPEAAQTTDQLQSRFVLQSRRLRAQCQSQEFCHDCLPEFGNTLRPGTHKFHHYVERTFLCCSGVAAIKLYRLHGIIRYATLTHPKRFSDRTRIATNQRQVGFIIAQSFSTRFMALDYL
jgi:hypothetical protein